MNEQTQEEVYYDFEVLYNQRRVERKIENIVSLKAVNKIVENQLHKVGFDKKHNLDVCRRLVYINGEETITAKRFISLEYLSRLTDGEMSLDLIDEKLARDLKETLAKNYKLNNKPVATKCVCCNMPFAYDELYQVIDNYMNMPIEHSISDVKDVIDDITKTYEKIKEIKANE